MNIVELSPNVGAEVSGVDVTTLSDAGIDELKHLLWNRGVVFIRDQDLTPDRQLAFAEKWGDINVNRFFSAVPEQPRVAQVLKEPDQDRNIGGGWHTDHSYDRIPAMGSLLYALELPSLGGDTMFASMYAAYDSLSKGLQDTLESMRAVHSSRHVFGANTVRGSGLEDRFKNADQAVQDAVHPVVIRHPESGRPALYVNPGFTVRFENWTAEESAPLLSYLYGQAVRPELTLRYQWTPRTLAIWDNRATWHYALNDYHGERRLMHRVTVEGVALDGFASAGAA